MSKNITRKMIVNTLVTDGIADIIAGELDAPVEDVTTAIEKMIAAANRPVKSKPSAETMRSTSRSVPFSQRTSSKRPPWSWSARYSP